MATAVGVHALGKGLDYKFPLNQDSSWARFLKPNLEESVGLAVAMTLPIRKESAALRYEYMGGAYLVAHALNLLPERDNPKTVRDQAFADLTKDSSERSAASMNRAIEQFKQLGKDHENALKLYRDDWPNRAHDDKITNLRGMAALNIALGETRFEKGTLIPYSKAQGQDGVWSQVWHTFGVSFTEGHDRQYNDLLPEGNLDLGGEALSSFRASKAALAGAQEQTRSALQQNANATVSGTRVRQSEADDLSQLEKRVDASLSKIYGKHDIATAYKSVQEVAHISLDKFDKFVRQEILHKLDLFKTDGDKQFLAKLHRDLALCDLAIAGVKVGHNGIGSGQDPFVATIIQEAQSHLEKARELDAGNEDTPQLEQLAQAIHSGH